MPNFSLTSFGVLASLYASSSIFYIITSLQCQPVWGVCLERNLIFPHHHISIEQETSANSSSFSRACFCLSFVLFLGKGSNWFDWKTFGSHLTSLLCCAVLICEQSLHWKDNMGIPLPLLFCFLGLFCSGWTGLSCSVALQWSKLIRTELPLMGLCSHFSIND